MTVYSRQVIISNKLGLHARAATKLAQLTQKFDAKVTVQIGDKEADASSIMGLMLLAGGQGKMVTVSTQGTEAEEALDKVCQLFTDKFDEAE